MNQDKTTHFGYQTVGVEEKASKVAEVFHSVASKYDVMNDIMSMGVHRLWKRYLIDTAGIKPGMRVLDLAGGTGDLSLKLSPRVGKEGEVVLSDINGSMLSAGRDRLLDAGILNNVSVVQADAETLPFPDHYFDVIFIAFGLRNVTDKDKALASMHRCLKPGGQSIVLEFSKVEQPVLSKLYDTYSFNFLPTFGKLVANDAESYRYLAESIRMHPDQETLKSMMQGVGFEDCSYENLTGGIVAIHKGWKY